MPKPKLPYRGPWAFDDCPQWKAFKQKAEEAGLTLRCASEWGANSTNRYRGATVVKYLVHRHGAFVTSIIVEGFGPNGFALYYESQWGEVGQDIAHLQYLARPKEARS